MDRGIGRKKNGRGRGLGAGGGGEEGGKGSRITG